MDQADRDELPLRKLVRTFVFLETRVELLPISHPFCHVPCLITSPYRLPMATNDNGTIVLGAVNTGFLYTSTDGGVSFTTRTAPGSNACKLT